MRISKFNLIAGLIGFGLFATSGAFAASTTVNMTGCLQRGDKAHQYSMKDGNGKMYELLPAAGMNMKKHVGEEVMVTGYVTKTHKESANGGEYLRVNQVTRVNSSCTAGDNTTASK